MLIVHGPMIRSEVAATVNGQMLSEGEGFSVHYDKGRIEVLAAAIRSPDSRFRISAGNSTCGNY